jgi:hypothetical protein
MDFAKFELGEFFRAGLCGLYCQMIFIDIFDWLLNKSRDVAEIRFCEVSRKSNMTCGLAKSRDLI